MTAVAATEEDPPDAADADAIAIVVCFEDASRDRFLMARHRERGWELPGGRVRPDEDPVEAAVREFGEETGHRLLDPKLVVEQERERGTFFVVAGRWGPQGEDLTREAEPIVERRFVERVTDVEPLAFPDDPYDAVGEALGRPLM